MRIILILVLLFLQWRAIVDSDKLTSENRELTSELERCKSYDEDAYDKVGSPRTANYE
jgi:hypothetical protein